MAGQVGGRMNKLIVCIYAPIAWQKRAKSSSVYGKVMQGTVSCVWQTALHNANYTGSVCRVISGCIVHAKCVHDLEYVAVCEACSESGEVNCLCTATQLTSPTFSQPTH